MPPPRGRAPTPGGPPMMARSWSHSVTSSVRPSAAKPDRAASSRPRASASRPIACSTTPRFWLHPAASSEVGRSTRRSPGPPAGGRPRRRARRGRGGRGRGRRRTRPPPRVAARPPVCGGPRPGARPRRPGRRDRGRPRPWPASPGPARCGRPSRSQRSMLDVEQGGRLGEAALGPQLRPPGPPWPGAGAPVRGAVGSAPLAIRGRLPADPAPVQAGPRGVVDTMPPGAYVARGRYGARHTCRTGPSLAAHDHRGDPTVSNRRAQSRLPFLFALLLVFALDRRVLRQRRRRRETRRSTTPAARAAASAPPRPSGASTRPSRRASRQDGGSDRRSASSPTSPASTRPAAWPSRPTSSPRSPSTTRSIDHDEDGKYARRWPPSGRAATT